MPLRIGVPKECLPNENRVAATPDSVKKLCKLGFEVTIEHNAGLAAGFDDPSYVEAGATISDIVATWSSDIIAKIRPPVEAEISRLSSSQTIISFLYPAFNTALIQQLSARGVTAIGMDQVPRTTRAQKVDALSSMGNLAGYRAIIEAANAMQRPLLGQSTAAGKIPPCKVLVIGAGVAGLAAIGAAKSMGAIVRAFDTRPAVKDQVASMGAEFLEVQIEEDGSGSGGYAKEMSPAFIAAEMELFAAQAKEVDIIVTTALIPGKRAPTLITAAMVASMKRGSVVVDLAAEQEGNCELTRPGAAVVEHGVTIIGYTDFPSRMALQASMLYANNIVNLLAEMGGAEQFAISETNDIVRPMTVLNAGVLKWPPPKPPASAVPVAAAPAKVAVHRAPGHNPAPSGKMSSGARWAMLVAGLALLGIGYGAPPTFVPHFTVFVLACFVGYHVVWSVTPALHTPLMSVTNAISGIIVIGGMVQVGSGSGGAASVLGIAAILLASINIVGGFLVTQRMLRMFHR